MIRTGAPIVDNYEVREIGAEVISMPEIYFTINKNDQLCRLIQELVEVLEKHTMQRLLLS